MNGNYEYRDFDRAQVLVVGTHPGALKLRSLARPAAASLDAPRLGRLARGVASAWTTFLDWLNRLGARRIDPAGLEQMHTCNTSLRVKGIGH